MSQAMMAHEATSPHRSSAQRRRVRSGASIPCLTAIHAAGDQRRAEVEAYLETAYGRAFGGRIREHYPILMSAQAADGVILGATGIRLAETAPLFLEQYIEEPVESAISRISMKPATRSEIAEIGNLACGGSGASVFLFVNVASYLLSVGRTYAVATATRQLRRSFGRAGFQTQVLSAADPGRLPDGGADWGAYYSREPEVLAGAIAPALPRLSGMLAPFAGRMRGSSLQDADL